jgi:hypothetical protein
MYLCFSVLIEFFLIYLIIFKHMLSMLLGKLHWVVGGGDCASKPLSPAFKCWVFMNLTASDMTGGLLTELLLNH